MKIVIASGNQGKIKEIAALLYSHHIELIPQQMLNVQEVPETGLTFVENALIKARHAAKATGLYALADDSGLVVPVLKGAPGIYSARFAGAKANDQTNIAKLLTELQHVKSTERRAYYYCVLVLLRNAFDPAPLICTATWHGCILEAPRGLSGFGYDPIFYLPELNCSAAELSIELKNKLSHRGQALQQLLTKLPDYL